MVHLCHLKETGEEVAVKTIPMYVDDEKEREHMICEVATLNESNFQYLVNLRGAYFDDDSIHLAMEYMDGGSLRDIMNKVASSSLDRLPESILGKIAIAILRAMNYLKKEKGVMHRDIKPDNVLISSSGAIKLCDLGIAKKLEGSIAKTNVGTTLYLSPERIDPSASVYNVTADVWSFGIAMMEMALGRFPYNLKGSSEFLVLDAIVNKPSPTLDLKHGWSEEIVHFLAASLEKDPQLRPRPWELLEHPFILKWSAAQVDVAAWLAALDADIASSSSDAP